jgi:hypothetical protein
MWLPFCLKPPQAYAGGAMRSQETGSEQYPNCPLNKRLRPARGIFLPGAFRRYECILDENSASSRCQRGQSLFRLCVFPGLRRFQVWKQNPSFGTAEAQRDLLVEDRPEISSCPERWAAKGFLAAADPRKPQNRVAQETATLRRHRESAVIPDPAFPVARNLFPA